MIAVARYLLAEHFRTRQFVAPLLLLAAGVVVLYSQPPNPVLSTAGTVAAFVFADLAWFSWALLNTQSDADRQLLTATVGPRTLALGRLLALAALMLAATALAIAFPLVTGRFEATPTPTELALLTLATLLGALAGATLGALFARPFVRSRAIAVLGLAAALVLAVPLDLSPAISVAHDLDTTETATACSRLLATLAPVAAFALAVGALCVAGWRRRE